MSSRLESLPAVLIASLPSPRTSQRIISKVSTIFQISHPENTWERCFSAVLEACRQRKWELIEACKNELAQLTDQYGRPLLLHIVQSGDQTLALELIEQKVTLLAQDSEGNTALHIAARTGDLEIIGKLYGKIPIDAPNSKRQTPLHVAIGASQSDVVIALLANQANKDAPFIYNTLEVTPLSYAVIRGELDCVKALCQQANISKTLTTLGNLLHLAVHFQQNEVLYYLLKHHKEACQTLIEQQDSHGYTPVALAVLVDNYQGIALLHACGANLESQDFHGRSLLHHAAEKLNENLIKYLYYLGCKLTATDHQNKRPVDLVTGSHEEARLINTLLNTLMSRDKNLENKPPQFAYQTPQSIVFKGGGPKGLAYVGAQRVLQTKGILKSVLRFAGTSAGAINATMLAFNFSYEEMLIILGDPNFLKSLLDVDPNLDPKLKKLFDDVVNNLFGQTHILKGILAYLQKKSTFQVIESSIPNLWTRTGFCLGEKLRLWIEEQIKNKSGIEWCTFRELRLLIQNSRNEKLFRHLHIFATKLGNSPSPIHFTSEEASWADDVIISDAVRASMSIPGAYIPHTLHKKINGQRVPCTELGTFVDGGLTYNFPVEFADRKKYVFHGLSSEEGDCPIFNKRTLGFSLYSPEEKEIPDSLKIENIGQLTQSIIDLYSNAETVLRQMNPYNMHRVIEIDNKGVGLLEFDMTPEKQQKLLQSGANAMEVFLIKQGGTIQEDSLFYLPRILKEIQRAVSLKLPHPHLVRRTSLLKVLEEALLSKKSAVHILYGPGGVGKSELAITFANDHLEDFSLVWLISCGSHEELSLGYRTLASALKVHIDERDSIEVIIQKVHIRLAQNTGKPWLLIFDNLNDSAILPERGGIVLITAYSRGRYINATEVPPFSKEEALQLLETVTRKESPLYLELIEMCGCYPLLLGQIAPYLARTSISIEDYLDLLKAKINPLSQDERYPKTLETALELNLKELPRLALVWLSICCNYNPVAIPISYLDRWLKYRAPQNKAQLILQRQNILDALCNRGLIRYDQNANTFSMNLVLQEKLRGNGTTLDLAVKVLQSFISSLDFDTSADWMETMKEATLWASHAQEILKFLKNSSFYKAELLEKLGVNMFQEGNYKMALQYHQQACDIRKMITHEKSLLVALSLYNMAICLHSLGKVEDALLLHSKALDIRKNIPKEILQDNRLCKAMSYNQIGNCYRTQGKIIEALKYHSKALKIRKAICGQEHYFKGESLNNLANCFYSLNNNQEALTHYFLALGILKPILGNSHPSVGTILFNIANCFLSQEKYKDALDYHMQALSIRKKAFGEYHLKVAESLYKIACCYANQGKYIEALSTFNQALNAAKVNLEDNHPFLKQILDNIEKCKECEYEAFTYAFIPIHRFDFKDIAWHSEKLN